MEIKISKNKIYIRKKNIAVLNATILDKNSVYIELLKVENRFRNQKFAKKILKKSLKYFEDNGFKNITLNALPLDNNGLNLEALKLFYKKFDFQEIQSFERSKANMMMLSFY